jgi:hypothetical protein
MLKILFGLFFGLLGFALGLMMQVGPHDAGTNFCGWSPFPKKCLSLLPDWFDRWGWMLPTCLVVAAIILITWAPLHALLNRRSHNSYERELTAMESIWWIVERSAYGRWLDATIGKVRDLRRMTLVASELQRRHLENGDLIAKGRRRGSIDYSDIDRRFWEHVMLHVETDLTSIFRATILGREASTIQIPDYDRLTIDRKSLEEKFPEHDLRISRELATLRLRSKCKEIVVSLKTAAKKMEPSHIIILGLVIALGGTIWSLYQSNRAKEIPQVEIEEITKPLKSQLETTTQEKNDAIKQRDDIQKKFDEAQRQLQTLRPPAPLSNQQQSISSGKIESLTSKQKVDFVNALIELQPNLPAVFIERSSAGPFSQNLSVMADLFARAGIDPRSGVQNPRPGQTGLQIGVLISATRRFLHRK